MGMKMADTEGKTTVERESRVSLRFRAVCSHRLEAMVLEDGLLCCCVCINLRPSQSRRNLARGCGIYFWVLRLGSRTSIPELDVQG